MALNRDELSRAAQVLETELSARRQPQVFAPLAEVHRLSGRPEEAVRLAREGLREFPDHLGIRIVLARALADSQDAAGARAAYGEVLVRDPGNEEARAYVEARPDHPSQAGPEPLRGEETPVAALPAPDDVPSSAAMPAADLAEELGQLADLFSPRAADSFAADESPGSIVTLTLAEIYARQGLYDRAVDVCRAILARSPDDPEARERLQRYQEQLASVT